MWLSVCDVGFFRICSMSFARAESSKFLSVFRTRSLLKHISLLLNPDCLILLLMLAVMIALSVSVIVVPSGFRRNSSLWNSLHALSLIGFLFLLWCLPRSILIFSFLRSDLEELDCVARVAHDVAQSTWTVVPVWGMNSSMRVIRASCRVVAFWSFMNFDSVNEDSFSRITVYAVCFVRAHQLKNSFQSQ